MPPAAADRGPNPAARAADGADGADRAPQLLGVDELALRKGCTYSTVLVDVEADQVVGVLPDRTFRGVPRWSKGT